MRLVKPEELRAERAKARSAATPVKKRRINPAKLAQIIKEIKERPYQELICGHFTRREIQELYEIWRPYETAKFCEACQFWTDLKQSEKVKKEYPEEPEF